MKVLVVGSDAAVSRIFIGRGFTLTYGDNPDLVVFTGGPDVSPKLYNEEPLPRTSVSLRRDELDLQHYNKFKGIPKIGICRGAQFLNVMCGGALWQDVNNHTSEHVAIDVLLGKSPVRVTSTHHQMMIPTDEGEVLAIANEATQYLSDDKTREDPMFDAEVVWYEKQKALCFQPHPEYKNKDSKNPYECRQYFFDLVDYFFNP